ncbi:MAG: hypothetical protein E6F94_06225 [Actinobacteria bacterium]|nr:MAG: hypothetical protein E6G38_05660 [Actinomycetota bacterium]TMM26283.1 MAG: hypothetical protein E6F94_06225 [Actinomycetota bacterium]
MSTLRDELPRLDELLWRLSPAWLLLLVVGGYGAVLTRWRTGGFLMLAAVLGEIGTHLFLGVRAYRRVMRRPWPRVRALDDWD